MDPLLAIPLVVLAGVIQELVTQWRIDRKRRQWARFAKTLIHITGQRAPNVRFSAVEFDGIVLAEPVHENREDLH